MLQLYSTECTAIAESQLYYMTGIIYNTSAPSSSKVSIRTAVCTVMCRQPAILAPLSGLVKPYLCLIVISPGISASARSISLRPKAAKSRLAACCVVLEHYHDRKKKRTFSRASDSG